MPEKEERAVRKLVVMADNDPELLARLCAEPEAVAKEFGVVLKAGEMAQLKRVGELRRLVSEFTEARIPDPLFYPIDIWWGREVARHVLFYNPIMYPMRYPIRDWIFYPAPEQYWRGPGLVGQTPGLLRRRVR
jgi:hypothetical protein